MSNTTTKQDKNELTVLYEVDGQQIKLTPSIVQNYLIGSNTKITMQEFKFFTELCKARGLNPFLKEAYCIKYGNEPAALVVGKDAILKRAIRHPQFNGIESGIIVINSDNAIIERVGAFNLPDEKVVGGWARVYRKDWEHSVYASVALEEAAQKKKDGNYNTFWHTKPATMVEKVAKVRALREAFVEAVGGMYEAEEMGADLPMDNTADNIIDTDEVDGAGIQDQEPQQVSMADL